LGEFCLAQIFGPVDAPAVHCPLAGDSNGLFTKLPMLTSHTASVIKYGNGAHASFVKGQNSGLAQGSDALIAGIGGCAKEANGLGVCMCFHGQRQRKARAN
jgi:hypothetical protein